MLSWKRGSVGKVYERNFEVVIYEKDYKELCAHVLRKPHIETGGDLFGLWADEHKAVIGFTLGPGKECKRTSVSFYQDVRYLEEVGSYLTQNEGVCHIGEWHSHHQLGLARPSGGDENTVWNNMPTYKLSRFVIFIANIEASHHRYKVNIGCFLFEIDSKGNQLPVLQGKFKILHSENPFSRKKGMNLKRDKGAEEKKGDEFNIDIKNLELEEGGKTPQVIIERPVRNKRNYPDDDKNVPQQTRKMNKLPINETQERKNTASGASSGSTTKVKPSEPENGDESEPGLSTDAHQQPSVPEDSGTPEDKGKTPTGVTTGASVAVEEERREDKEAKDKEEREKKLGEEEEETPQLQSQEKKKSEGGNAGDQRKEAKDDSKVKPNKKAANIEGGVNNEGKANRKGSRAAESKRCTPQVGQQGRGASTKPGKAKATKPGASTSPGNVAGKTAGKSVRNPASAGKEDPKKKKKEEKKNQKTRTPQANERGRQETHL